MDRKQMAILACLEQNAGRVVSHEELIRAMQGDGTESVIDADLHVMQMRISKIRKARGPDSTPIHTIIGIGYCLGDLQFPDKDVAGQLRFGRMVLDPKTGILWQGEKEHTFLTKEERIALSLLAEKGSIGRVVRYARLIEAIWGYGLDSLDDIDIHTLQVLMARLRKKLGENALNPSHIQTVIGRGYRFHCYRARTRMSE